MTPEVKLDRFVINSIFFVAVNVSIFRSNSDSVVIRRVPENGRRRLVPPKIASGGKNPAPVRVSRETGHEKRVTKTSGE